MEPTTIQPTTDDTTTATAADAPPPPLYHLASSAADGPLRPAVTLGPAYPAAVSGLPAFYYWKDALRVGHYAHPAGRYSLRVTRDKLDGYAAAFAAMRANGVGVPILMDHAPTAAATLGWIVAVRRDGDRLLELHQFLGEDARDTGLRNHVSLGIDPDYVDGRGVRYGEAIVHSAVTPVPVVPGQDEFTALATDDGGGRTVVTLSRVEGERPTTNAQRSTSNEGGHGGGYGGGRDHGTGDGPAPSAVEHWTFGQPSGQPMTLSLLTDAAVARRDLAVARGGVDPATADALLALLVDPSAAAAPVNLARTAAGRPLAVAVFDALAANRPVPLGESTGPQSVGRLHLLARVAPGTDGGPAGDLTGRMIALASGTAGG